MTFSSCFSLLAVVFIGIAFHSTADGRNLQSPQVAANFKVSFKDQTNPTCQLGASDFVFVMDQSGSIGSSDYQLGKSFAAGLTEDMMIGSAASESKVGLVLFDGSANVSFNLNTYTSNLDVYNAVMSVGYSGGGTNIANGMNKALDEVFVASNGNRDSVPNIMFVMTDGADDSDVVSAHNRAAQRNITIFAIGIGPGVYMDQLLKIAGDASRVFTAANYSSLHDYLPTICTELTGVAPQTTAMPILHTPRQCSCTIEKVWLDIILVVEVSDSMTSAGLNQAKAPLVALIEGLKIDQAGDMTSRVAIIYFSKTAQILGNLTTYDSTDATIDAIYSIPYVGDHGVNLQGALQAASHVITYSDKRPTARNMIILLTSSNQVGPFQDPTEIANQLKSGDNVIVTIAFAQTQESTPPFINFASPGMNFTSRDPNFYQEMFYAFCDTNCYCPPNWFRFTVGNEKWGECVYPGDFAAPWTTAQHACQSTRSAFLADELSPNKQYFLLDLAKNLFPGASPFGFWIGLKYDNGAATWERGNISQSDTISSVDYQNWATGNSFPSSAGDCAAEAYFGAGNFATKWQVKNCNSAVSAAFNYFCQKPACDTDTWCF